MRGRFQITRLGTNKDFQVIVLCCVLTTALGILFIGNKNFSLDELDSIFITQNWSALIHSSTYYEGNMWLYYLLLYFWRFLGNSETTVRLLSVLFAAGTIPFAYLLGKTLFGRTTATITALLLSVHIVLLSNAQNARSYILVLFLTTVSTFLFSKFVLNNKNNYLATAALLNVLAVYGHMYAVFIIGAQFLSLFLLPKGKKIQKVILYYAIASLLLIPLLLAPSLRSGQINWIPTPTIKNLVGTFILLANDFLPLAVIFAGLLITYVARSWGRLATMRLSSETWKYGLVLSLLLTPIVFSFLFSLLVKPIYTSTYFYISVVPFLLLTALAIQALKQKQIRVVVLGLMLMLSALRLVGWYTSSKPLSLVIHNYNEDWRGTATFLTRNESQTDAVIFLPATAKEKINYYIEKQKYPALKREIPLQFNYLSAETAPKGVDEATLRILPPSINKVWYVRVNLLDASLDRDNDIITKDLSAHYRLTSTVQHNSITIYEYDRQL